jgi:hypothetical protein
MAIRNELAVTTLTAASDSYSMPIFCPLSISQGLRSTEETPLFAQAHHRPVHDRGVLHKVLGQRNELVTSR